MDPDYPHKYFTNLTTKVFSAGSTIFYQGEIPNNVYIVKSGTVKVYSINKNGEERIVDFKLEQEFLASSWVYGNTTSCIFYYQALTECEVYMISKSAYLQQASLPEVLQQQVKLLQGHNTASLIRITALVQARARDKILFTFYYLAKRFGKELAEDWVTIQISLTHQMIADLVGLTRETTAVELNVIKKTKVLSYKRQKYMVHVGRLLKMIDEDSFGSIDL